jgi:capsular polysaccharide transport system permease protein
MKLTVNRFRTRRPEPVAAPAPLPRAAARPKVIGDDAFFPSAHDDGFAGMTFPTAQKPGSAPSQNDAPQDIDLIRREGLTGRQLRMARRLAQKHNLPATSDFDAVRLLRNAGIDPFQANSVLELVSSVDGPPPPTGSRALTITPGGDGIQLPKTMKPMQLPSTEMRAEHAHIAEVMKIQRDMARRRRKKSILLAARLFVFVLLPTLMAGIYYYTIATPFFSTKTEFVIQQAQAPSASGLGGLMSGTPMAGALDSITVQGYLQSQDAMQLLDQDNGFRAHYSNPEIDPIQRLDPGASNASAYKVYRRNVKISYDPTEGIVKMEVIAADPEKAVDFSKALIGYAEDRVDEITTRLRDDQMSGALESYEGAEVKLHDANMRVVELQKKYKVLSSEAEVGMITGQITGLETQLQQDNLSLAQMESNASPNKARLDPLKRRIATLQSEIALLRAKLTEDDAEGLSLANVQSELLVAQADVQTRQLLLAQSLQAMESARAEANRQTRYLSISVNPIAQDEAAYPRAFENTIVVMLIFAGVYLMISMTFAILREQITA